MPIRTNQKKRFYEHTIERKTGVIDHPLKPLYVSAKTKGESLKADRLLSSMLNGNSSSKSSKYPQLNTVDIYEATQEAHGIHEPDDDDESDHSIEDTNPHYHTLKEYEVCYHCYKGLLCPYDSMDECISDDVKYYIYYLV
jgi:hypothetical protein